MKVEKITEELPPDHLYAMARPQWATGDVLRRLTWKGTKIPRAAEINGRWITWAQHGRVFADGLPGGREIGHYVRLIEWGGPEKDEHEMLIWSAT